MMKHLIVLFTLCTAAPTLFAQDSAGNHVDAGVKARIARGCEHQMSTLTPERLKDFNVSQAAFCACIATRHVRHAKQDLLADDVDQYLKTVVAFYAAPTPDASAPLRRRNQSIDEDDIGFGDKCNQK